MLDGLDTYTPLPPSLSALNGVQMLTTVRSPNSSSFHLLWYGWGLNWYTNMVHNQNQVLPFLHTCLLPTGTVPAVQSISTAQNSIPITSGSVQRLVSDTEELGGLAMYASPYPGADKHCRWSSTYHVWSHAPLVDEHQSEQYMLIRAHAGSGTTREAMTWLYHQGTHRDACALNSQYVSILSYPVVDLVVPTVSTSGGAFDSTSCGQAPTQGLYERAFILPFEERGTSSTNGQGTGEGEPPCVQSLIQWKWPPHATYMSSKHNTDRPGMEHQTDGEPVRLSTCKETSAVTPLAPPQGVVHWVLISQTNEEDKSASQCVQEPDMLKQMQQQRQDVFRWETTEKCLPHHNALCTAWTSPDDTTLESATVGSTASCTREHLLVKEDDTLTSIDGYIVRIGLAITITLRASLTAAEKVEGTSMLCKQLPSDARPFIGVWRTDVGKDEVSS